MQITSLKFNGSFILFMGPLKDNGSLGSLVVVMCGRTTFAHVNWVWFKAGSKTQLPRSLSPREKNIRIYLWIRSIFHKTTISNCQF